MPSLAAFVGGSLFCLIALALLWRLPMGIDLSDEAYYAIFVDDWLKGGIRTSTLTTVHQTALLPAFAILRIRAELFGNSDGLVLSLRWIYLIFSIVSAVAWLSLFIRLSNSFYAWLCAAFALAFIPFGLPSVSYNTLGIQGLTIALSGLGHTLLDRRPLGLGANISAAGWAIATTAYPSLFLPLGVCWVLVSSMYGVRFGVRYGAVVLAFQLIGWPLVAVALAPDHLLRSVNYLAAINDVGGWERKLDYSLQLLRGSPTFVGVCLGAIVVGLLRTVLGPALTGLLIAALVAWLFSAPYVLFCRSHDVVTVVALTGIGLVFGLRNRAPDRHRVIALLWLVSFAAGLTTMASAYNSVLNFPVGAAAAAAISLIGLASAPASLWPAKTVGRRIATKLNIRSRWLVFAGRSTALIVSMVGVLVTSLFHYYGDYPNVSPSRTLVSSGAYAGLRGQPEQVETIRWMQDTVSPLIGTDMRIAFVGRIYGLILATPARPSMLAVFPLSDTMNPRGLALSQAFFEEPAHRPSIVVTHEDCYYKPFNPIGPKFADWYQEILNKEFPLGSFTVYRRL